MKRNRLITLLAIISGIITTSCLSSYDDDYEEYQKQLEEKRRVIFEQYNTDSTIIANYLIETDSVAQFDTISGIFYHIINPGDELHPGYYSNIEVQYTGMLTDGYVFDQSQADTTKWFQLNQLIEGWQVGLQYIGKGGNIVLYLPSYYGFGAREYEDVPANSVLIFNVDLISFY